MLRGLAAVLLTGAVLLVAVALGWRAASRRWRLPCPVWMEGLLRNPYVEALAGHRAILDHLDLSPGMRVLDVGCGPGRVAIPAAERVGPAGEVVALDLQEGMLARVQAEAAQRGLANVRTVRGTIESGVAGDAAFDRALLVTVLGEIPNREAAMDSIFAALRPGGLLSVTELMPDPHYQTRRTVRRLAEAAGFHLKGTYGTWLAFTMTLRRPVS